MSTRRHVDQYLRPRVSHVEATCRWLNQSHSRAKAGDGFCRPGEVTHEDDKLVCLKMGYTPNYSHLVGIMIINHWILGYTIFRQTQMMTINFFGECESSSLIHSSKWTRGANLIHSDSVGCRYMQVGYWTRILAHRIHGAGILMLTWLGLILMGSMLPYIAYMDPMGSDLGDVDFALLWCWLRDGASRYEQIFRETCSSSVIKHGSGFPDLC